MVLLFQGVVVRGLLCDEDGAVLSNQRLDGLEHPASLSEETLEPLMPRFSQFVASVIHL